MKSQTQHIDPLLDNWKTNWETSYLSATTDTPNKLRVAGESPKTNRLFIVTPGLEYEFTYTQSENASVNLFIEESDNGTSWQNVVSNASSNGTQTVSFIPSASLLKVSFEASGSFKLQDISLNGELFDTLVVAKTLGGTGYRYGYQSWERDDEIKGSGNHISWGDYGYDPRIVRRWQPDPLQAKYPWQSPYSVLGNNPILNREIDGRDYEVYVNHETKTIIIKATYYTAKGNTDDYNSAVKATEFWNEQSGKYQYKVGQGEEAQYYNIQFDLNVNSDLDNPKDALAFQPVGNEPVYDDAGNQIGSQYTGIERVDPSANTYSIVEDNSKIIIENSTDLKHTLGTTEGGNKISVSRSNASNSVGAHEIGHTLGFRHLINTIMSEAHNIGHKEQINIIIISTILGNVGIGRYNYGDYSGGGEGTLSTPTGTAPSNFNNGIIVNKKTEDD